MKIKSNRRIDAPLTAANLVRIHDSHISYFNELWTRGSQNELYRMGINFSDAQRKDIANQDRYPFPSPITADKLNRIIGSERKAVTSIKAEATKPESEIKAELLTMRFKKVESDSGFSYVRSEVFESGVAMIYGVGEVRMKYDSSGNKIVVIDDVDYRNVIWDSSARLYDKSDGSFMAKRKAVYRRDIAKDYGRMVANSITTGGAGWGREITDYWGVSDQLGNRDNDVINVFTHWQKMLVKRWHIVWDGEVVSKENSKKEATEVVKMLKIPYVVSGEDIPRVDVVSRWDEVYDKYNFTYNEILEYERTELEFFPLHVYQSLVFKDKIYCLTDILKPQNKLMDKLLMQIDYAFGADLKNGWEIVTSWLDQGNSFDEAVTKLKNGTPVAVVRPGAVKSIPMKGANPQWFQIYEILARNITEYSGGSLYSTGQQPGAAREAKETVARKLRQQELIANLFISNLRRWNLTLFKKVIWFLDKYDTEEYVMKVHGGNLSEGMVKLLQENKVLFPSEVNENVSYLKMNQPDNKLSWLKGADVDLTIKEENVSDTEKEVQFGRMIQVEQTDPELKLSPTWRKLKLDKLSESYEDRQKIVTEIDEARQQQQKQAQEDKQLALDFQREKLNLDKAKALISDKGTQV